MEVPVPAGADDTLNIDGDLYRLVQYHFHVPAEHAAGGRLADLETHFVPTRTPAASRASPGVFFSIGRRPNPLLDTILLAAPAIGPSSR